MAFKEIYQHIKQRKNFRAHMKGTVLKLLNFVHNIVFKVIEGDGGEAAKGR